MQTIVQKWLGRFGHFGSGLGIIEDAESISDSFRTTHASFTQRALFVVPEGNFWSLFKF